MCYKVIKNKFQKIMPSRQEGASQLKLFHLEDYPDMKGERFEFLSDGNMIRGYKYYYKKGDYKAVIIFHHGFGAGHNAYEESFNLLAKHGYLIYAYDNDCCGESDGSGWWNFSSSLVDQENFFKWFETDEEQKGLKRIIMGHSWGGFTALNGLRYSVDKIVSISAFTDIVGFLTQFMPPLKLASPLLRMSQRHYYGKYGNVNCRKLLQKSSIPALLIHGDKDDTVNYQKNFVPLMKKLKDKKNIEFYTAEGKAHQPYMSMEAQEYYDYLNGLLRKKEELPEVDYPLLLGQDQTIFDKIFTFIDD